MKGLCAEILMGSTVTVKADIYSTGMVLWEIATQGQLCVWR